MSAKAAQYADRFRSVFEQAAEAAVGDKQKLQQQIAALQDKRIEIAQQIEALEKQLAEINDDILVGLKHAATEAGVLLGIFEQDGKNGVLQGRISVSGIIRGIWQNGFVGYSIAGTRESKGYMTEALRRVVRYGFEDLLLHRLQASIIPRNTASQRVLEKCNFRYEGRALRYLKIQEVWEDHDLFAITADEMGKVER